MRIVIALLMLCPLIVPSLSVASEPAAAASEPAAVASRTANIDQLLDRAMAQNLIAGGVVVVGNHEGILATSARGTLNDAAGAPPLTEQTMFDVASLTKVIATTPAVMKLLDEGKINLADPVSRYLPEFAEAGRNDITIMNLLTHTSGLDDLSAGSGMQSYVRRAAAERNRPQPGSRFHYADINFILLGEVVQRVTGERLDVFCRDNIYAPLGASHTMFLPPRDLAGSIAPTSGYSAGVVQDGNARRLGGVAGHAGLFSSAADLALYARMLLGSGKLEDKQVISEATFTRMTTPYYCNNGAVRRGLGWDMDSPFAAPKGTHFSAASFGHTGYSGSSIWIDPQQDMFVIMLTRRMNYSNVRSFNQLRRDVSTMAALDLGEGGGSVTVASARPSSAVVASAEPAPAGLASASDAADMNAQVFEAAYPAIKPVSFVKVAAAPRQKVAMQARRGGRGTRVAKACSTRSRNHVRVAKNDAKSHKKRRTAVKG